MSIETRTKIASVTVGAGGVGIIDINNIPQTYSDLIVEFSLRTSYNGMADMYLRFSDAGGSTQYTYIRTGSNGIAQESTTANSVDNFVFAGGFGSNAPANYFGNGTIYIPDYTNSRQKTLLSRHGSSMSSGSDSGRLGMNAMYFNSTSPITRLYFSVAVGWAQNSTVSVYGVNNARRTAGNSIKAIGGNVEFDGTYVTHTFTATGSFTPTANIPSADILVVAGGGGGGGGGGNAPCGGGGGAGGLRYFSNQTLTAGTTYTCTVGAGGNGGTAGNSGTNGTNGSSGSSSQFGSLTATTGGGYGARSSTGSGEPGGNGGSGGGAGGGGAGSTTVATGIAGQGNNGGIWGGSGNEAAGGGGAGSAGLNSQISGSYLGTGGGGLTYFGKNFAGGGGGGQYYSAYGQATSGGGNGGYGYFGSVGASVGVAGSNNGLNGVPGSGGGGGGGAGYVVNSVNGAGGAGGSGTVIIRYKG